MKDKGKTPFKYKKRDAGTVAKRQNTSMYDNPFGSAPIFSPKGEHTVRFLPPTWDDAEHYGLDVYLHYSVGPDNNRYLCNQKMKGEPCPICEERDRANRAGEDPEYVKNLRPRKVVATYVIDRDKEKEGPKIWSMPPDKIDANVAKLCVNKKTGAVLYIDDPESGHDVSFEKKSLGKEASNVDYVGIQIDPTPTPLSDDDAVAAKWLEYAQEHPIPDCLVFYDYAYISNVLGGAGGAAEDEEGDKGPKTRHAAAATKPVKGKAETEEEEEEEEEEDEKPKGKKKAPIEDEEEELDEEDEEEEESDEEEDEEDEKPAKGKKGKAKDEEEEEDEDADEEEEEESDDEEEEEEKPKGKKSPLKKPSKK